MDEEFYKKFLGGEHIEEMGKYAARMTKAYYDELIKQGFTKKEALQIFSGGKKS